MHSTAAPCSTSHDDTYTTLRTKGVSACWLQVLRMLTARGAAVVNDEATRSFITRGSVADGVSFRDASAQLPRAVPHITASAAAAAAVGLDSVTRPPAAGQPPRTIIFRRAQGAQTRSTFLLREFCSASPMRRFACKYVHGAMQWWRRARVQGFLCRSCQTRVFPGFSRETLSA